MDGGGMTIAERMKDLGIVLPEPPSAGGNYVPAKSVGQMVYLSGSVSADRGMLITGTAGGLDSGLQEGYAAARCCALSQLAIWRGIWGRWMRLRRS